MYWEGRHLGRLPCGLARRILVDQVSTEDKQLLEQGRGHVGPGEFHDVVLDGIHATAGSSYYGDLGFTTNILEDLISTLTQSYRLLRVTRVRWARWEGRAHD
jgi:hypothetical protein